MARPKEFNEVEIKQFKGLDIRGPAELVPQNTFQTLVNWEIGLAGELKKRPGIVRQHNGATLGSNAIKILGEYSTNNFHHILTQPMSSANSGKMYWSNDSGVTWTQGSTPAGTDYQMAKGVQYNGVFYIPTGLSGQFFSWNGSVWANVGAGPPAVPASVLRPVILQDRLFMLELNTLNIRYSEVLQMSNIPANNSIAYSKTEDKDYPVGLIAYRDRLIILRQNSMQALYLNGLPTAWVMKTMPFPVGVVNENCALVYNDLLYLLTLDGIYRTDLTSVEEISKPLSPVFYQRRKTMFSASGGPSDAMGFWNGRLICSIKTGNLEFRMFVYNIDTQTWSEWIPATFGTLGYAYNPVKDFLTVNVGKRGGGASYQKEGLYMSSPDLSGKIYLFDDQNLTYMDEVSSMYNCIAKTRNINADLSEDIKRVYSMSVRGRKGAGGSVTGKFNVNGTDGSTFPITLDPTTRQSRFKGPGYFREASLQFSVADDQYMEVEAITAQVKRKSEISELKT